MSNSSFISHLFWGFFYFFFYPLTKKDSKSNLYVYTWVLIYMLLGILSLIFIRLMNTFVGILFGCILIIIPILSILDVKFLKRPDKTYQDNRGSTIDEYNVRDRPAFS